MEIDKQKKADEEQRREEEERKKREERGAGNKNFLGNIKSFDVEDIF